MNIDELASDATEPHKIAGDWGDDDPGVVDDLVQPDPEPPTPAELPREADTLPAVARKRPTRLLARSYTGMSAHAVMVFPADDERLSLVIENRSATTSFAFADDRSIVGGVYLAHIVAPDTVVTLGDYTGALWIVPVDANGIADLTGATVITASFSAVTR